MKLNKFSGIKITWVLLLSVILMLNNCGVPDNIHGKSNVNTPPVITDYYPLNASITAHDGDLLNFWIVAKDPDNDILVYNWQLNGMNVSNGTYYSFNVSISQGTRQVLTVVVMDSAGLQTEKTWLINVIM